MSVAFTWESVPFVTFMFFVEKFFYVKHWVFTRPPKKIVDELDAQTEQFFHIYGMVDAVFGMAFLFVSISSFY